MCESQQPDSINLSKFNPYIYKSNETAKCYEILFKISFKILNGSIWHIRAVFFLCYV